VSSVVAQLKLDRLYTESPRRKATSGERFVVMSDLHLGRGDSNDDFLRNSKLCLDALEHFYLARDYTLILNGDIEELLRVPRESVVAYWTSFYELLSRFRARGNLIWLIGNHEIVPGRKNDPFYTSHLDGESMVLEIGGRELFIFHGHQAGVANSGRFNKAIAWSLKLFANTLGIGNKSVAHHSVKKFKLEKAAYEFSRRRGLLSIMGHTHRPLFESRSKQESLNLEIDRLCRAYSRVDEGRRASIRRTVRNLKQQYLSYSHKGHPVSNVYGDILVPCLFNSGCAVGKRGFTALEIKNGHLGLIFWTSPERSPSTNDYNAYKPSRRFGNLAYRTILRRESLDYIYARIELLSRG